MELDYCKVLEYLKNQCEALSRLIPTILLEMVIPRSKYTDIINETLGLLGAAHCCLLDYMHYTYSFKKLSSKEERRNILRGLNEIFKHIIAYELILAYSIKVIIRRRMYLSSAG